MAPTDGYVPVPVIQIRWASSAPLTPPPSVLALACYEAMLLGMLAQVEGCNCTDSQSLLPAATSQTGRGG